MTQIESRIVNAVETMLNVDRKKTEITEDKVKTFLQFVISNNDFDIDKNQFFDLVKIILERNQVKVFEGILISENGDHEDWYEPTSDGQFWKDYKDFLINNQDLTNKKIDNLENDVINVVLNKLGNPKSDKSFYRRGMVIGDVQSGKTSMYIGLITKAADAGYKVIILMTGVTEILRSQTQTRLDEGFVGIDTSKLERSVINNRLFGVGLQRKVLNVNYLTTANEDFIGNKALSGYILNENYPNLFVIKKNKTVLNQLYNWLIRNKITQNPQINLPAIIIDDEADNASINTNKIDDVPTIINRSIRTLAKVFTKSNYLAITATPYANVFIKDDLDTNQFEEDLFPQDFIYVIVPPSDYIGPEQLFLEKSKYSRNVIDILDPEINTAFKFDHKKEDKFTELPSSLKEAILTFLITITIRENRNQKNKNHSMLVNISRFIKVQSQFKYLISEFLESFKKDVYTFGKKSTNVNRISSKKIEHLHKIYKKYNYENKIDWDILISEMYLSINDIQVKVVNSSKNSDGLNYSYEEPKKVIAIGGLALSRGLTLEGLSISYFYRNTKTYDVLMQMGRWFGYRRGYDDLFRVFIGKDSREWFKEIAESTIELKKDIAKMNINKSTPKEFGIRIRNDNSALAITAKNKMRNAVKKPEIVGYRGSFFETPYLHNDFTINKNNFDFVKELIKDHHGKRDKNGKYLIKNVSASVIADFIFKLDIPDTNLKFDKQQIHPFISQNKDPALTNWDIGIVESSDTKDSIAVGKELFKPVERSFTVDKKTVIRISGTNAKLGGPTDFLIGLDETLKAEKGSKAQDYLIKDRKPILLIYFVNLYKSKEVNELSSKVLAEQKKQPVIGISIGFPKDPNAAAKKVDYYVNQVYIKNNTNSLSEEE
jgi:hypothetical protein